MWGWGVCGREGGDIYIHRHLRLLHGRNQHNTVTIILQLKKKLKKKRNSPRVSPLTTLFLSGYSLFSSIF